MPILFLEIDLVRRARLGTGEIGRKMFHVPLPLRIESVTQAKQDAVQTIRLSASARMGGWAGGVKSVFCLS
jgi:hypothetical protein